MTSPVVTTVSSGVVSSGLTLIRNDELDVLSGGEADSTHLSGGVEIVSGGGRASAA